jgi:hypothetical protein
MLESKILGEAGKFATVEGRTIVGADDGSDNETGKDAIKLGDHLLD